MGLHRDEKHSLSMSLPWIPTIDLEQKSVETGSGGAEHFGVMERKKYISVFR